MSKDSNTEGYSQRDDRDLHDESAISFKREACRYGSYKLSSSCNERTRQKENRRKEKQEMLMQENERILNEIERRKKEMREKEKEIKEKDENEISKRKESEKQKEIEKEEKERVEKEIEREFQQKLSGKEKEFAKENSERDEREQEKVSVVFTNPHVSCSCSISSFQNSKDSCDNFQLQYFPDERRFKLIQKGKNIEDPCPPAQKGKKGEGTMPCESPLFHLNVCDNIDDDLVFEKVSCLDMANCHSLFDDNFILNGGMKSCVFDVIRVENFVDNIGLFQLVQILDVRDWRYPHKRFDLFNCHGYVNLLYFYTKSFCISMPVRMKFLLHYGISDQNREFKPGICYVDSFRGKLGHSKLSANNVGCNWYLM